MKLINTKIYTIVPLLLISFDAFAYLDPSTGGMIIQVLLAGIIGAGVFLRSMREKIYYILSKIKSFFTKRSQVNKENND
jgi:hypothetical protein